MTWREAVITRLIEQSAAGELRATRLLAELMWHCEPPPPAPASAAEEDPVEFLIAKFDRLAAEYEKEQQAAAAEIFAASW